MEKSQLRKLLFGVALVFASLVTFGGVQQKVYFDIASSHAIASRQNALVEIRASCAVEKSLDRCRTAALAAARSEQREEYDLYTQRTMALWTAIMGIMAITGAALSAIGIYLVWRTWDATREAAESSRKTLRSYIARERAVLSTSWATDSFDERSTTPVGFDVKVMNLGLSLARIYLIEWSFSAEPVWPEKMRYRMEDDITVLPNDFYRTEHLWWDEPYRETAERWFMGSMHYKTLEDELFVCHFSYELKYEPKNQYEDERWCPRECGVVGKPRNT